MALTKENYKERLIDKKINDYLDLFGAISIEGPKWCGKTWTGLNHASSVVYMTDKEQIDLAKVDPKYILKEDYPELIDEWQVVPSIWDRVRHECDADKRRGKFILTGSTTLEQSDDEEQVIHTGTGRIVTIPMYPMSLYEAGFSTGDVSITDMYNDSVNDKFTVKKSKKNN